MKTETLQKRFPMINEVWPKEDRAEKTGKCPWIMATCSTCMYRLEPDDYWKTGDENSYCVYKSKEDAQKDWGRHNER